MPDNLEVILKEFEVLRNEIQNRSKAQSNSLFWSLALIVAAFGSSVFRTDYIWVIPAAFSFFGYLWIENHSMINVIGEYIRVEMEEKLIADNTIIYKLNWESYLKRNIGRKFNYFYLLHCVYFNLLIIASVIAQLSLKSDNVTIQKYSVLLTMVSILFCLLFFIFSIRKYPKKGTFSP